MALFHFNILFLYTCIVVTRAIHSHVTGHLFQIFIRYLKLNICECNFCLYGKNEIQEKESNLSLIFVIRVTIFRLGLGYKKNSNICDSCHYF